MASSDSRRIRYELTVDKREPAEFEVLDFEVWEALSDDCSMVVRAGSADLFDGSEVLGKIGQLSVFMDEEPRVWRGVITGCTLRKTPTDDNLLEVEMTSRLALLGRTRGNRIFTGASAQTVVQEILKNGQIPLDEQDWDAVTDPPVRPHVLQRQESDLELVRRLLAREGIGYAVRAGAEKKWLVFFDDSPSLPPIDGDEMLLDRAGSNTDVDVVFDVRERAAVRSDATMLRDYDPLLPGANLDVRAPPKGGGVLETYLHPGGYTEQVAGKRLAQRTLERLGQDARGIAGRSDCARLEPGRRFTLAGHPRDSLNADYLLVEVVHRGQMGDGESDGDGGDSGGEQTDGRRTAYENTFTAIPKNVVYRPPLLPRPDAGPELAFVTCPPGEEIHVDEFGRSKVRFPWDRSGRKDDKSSAWLRVGQLPLGGSMTLPRKDFEVLVDFELGELDRPSVVGHLYNGKSPPPYALPQGATVSSLQTATTSGGPGANEMRFEDAGGAEEIFMNASRDFTLAVDNDALYSVIKNETCKVGSNAELLVGTDHVAEVKSNRKLQIGATQDIDVGGDYSASVGGDARVKVGGVRKVQCGGDHAETTTGALGRTVGALQSVTGLKGFARSVVGSSRVSVGAAWLEVVARSRASDVRGSRTETVGALKMVRAKNVSVSCGAALAINAAAQTVSCGGSRNDAAEGAVSVAAGGGLSVKAKSITIEAKNTLVMMLGACMIRLTKAGKIVIKAATVDLTGAKSLGQVNHGSN